MVEPLVGGQSKGYGPLIQRKGEPQVRPEKIFC